ncbi:DUF3576 domain-containing protein [Rhodovulum euryhalinum]|uniref:Uncharacterized protein DUF3576 n=1 Tax=Rhodovulum euryhalinum TaxID=35805 RepID=A0A4R2K8B0_9RHOB|nr:DUF3576 domain-containing protein [Rhodovulum euryhalinum]TCO69601.1 uncharacterized protein DUF3576 [Rhodovulum euryhalinum]
MTFHRIARGALIGMLAVGLSGCGDSGLFGRDRQPRVLTPEEGAALEQSREANIARQYENTPMAEIDRDRQSKSTIWDLFTNSDDPNTTVEVNKYLWQASLDVLNFLPIRSVDPFSGVIVTGYGTPPGGGRAYRATVYVQDPALDARSLKVALHSQSGAVDSATVRAVEDAIMTRARQIRIRDSKL